MNFPKGLLLAALTLFSIAAFAQTEDSIVIDNNLLFDSLASELNEYDEADYPTDTINFQPRSFSESKLQELREDKDFNYAEPPTVGESLLDRLMRWLGDFIERMFYNVTGTDWGNVLLYVLAVIVLVVIVLAVLKVDAFRIITKGDSNVTKGVFHENIHVMDFEKLIHEALAKRDFRNAVRLVFLQSLKLLSDRQHIDWQPGKTNHDYLDEVQTLEVKQGLGQLSYYFDYAWYGGFPISEIQFNRVKTIFETWRGTVS